MKETEYDDPEINMRFMALLNIFSLEESLCLKLLERGAHSVLVSIIESLATASDENFNLRLKSPSRSHTGGSTSSAGGGGGGSVGVADGHMSRGRHDSSEGGRKRGSVKFDQLSGPPTQDTMTVLGEISFHRMLRYLFTEALYGRHLPCPSYLICAVFLTYLSALRFIQAHYFSLFLFLAA